MNEGIIMLGSNVNPEENITKAKEKINDKYEIIDESTVLITLPRSKKYKNHFLNQAIKILSDEYFEDSVRFFKKIEQELGRTPEGKLKGLVPIDIDFVFWNETSMRDDYEKWDFVRTCIDQIKDKPSISLL
ncbi:MAG: 2-amino-4-hydroxy-6-hydroxymethyldihydropteridine diphosphokinase [Paludibacter sp.]|nr:2-amino-4-hydroxy-6-hydroxymethyldihydropteridine diphosphokinase [Paludibacter sp.]MDD4198803.1 2-amino-4-hydroxy-6-hydroxymethyldihydropteridine diphosphokinase [Paludibacter sp.]MDD4427497.1 2-amino-4-hydroxy-6-hydroxymethyldihydropteridine diphosphokinase [Paludibacter sp.]